MSADGFVIVRDLDQRAIMEGTHACSVRWGFDADRVRVYDTLAEALKSADLLCDEDDHAYVMHLSTWKLSTP